MMTNNLQEMIQSKPNVPFEYADFDPINTMPDKKEELATGIIASEASLIPIKMPEIPDSNYQPESEEALIDYVVSQNNRLEVATIFVKWEIGRSIKSFYQGKYGDRELEKIAQATGIGRDNLNKMIKFAEQYTLEQLNALIVGNFALPWNGISQNLAIKAETLIEVYEKAGNVSEFHNGIMNLKDPDEKRGKVKPPKIVEAPAMNVGKPEQLKVAATEITVTMISEKVAEKPVIVAPKIITDESIPTADLEYFKLQNEGLWKDLENTKQKIYDLYRVIDEHLREIEKRDILIRKYRERFNRLKYMIEDGYSADEIIELLAAVE